MYINGKFAASHGQEVFDLISPVDRAVIGQVTLGDEMDARAAISAAKAALRGNPLEPGVAIGPMVTEKQYDRVENYIRTGIEEGAEILIGGLGAPEGLEAGYFVKPTVFVGVTSKMTIAQEEIFGPVLSVITYETEEEAIQIANNSTYGLAAYVATTNQERGKRIASQLEAGGVMVNGLFDYYDHPEVPIGGFKMSGFGREFGIEGIEEYLETQAIFAA